MLIFSGILAWISFGLFILLVIKYCIRFLAIRFPSLRKINQIFSKTHKSLGILILFTSLLHGLTSSGFVFSFNYGSVSFVLFLCLFASYFFKRFYNQKFLFLHRILTILSILSITLHLIESGGFHLIDKIQKKDDRYILEPQEYRDGFYTGSGTGLKGEIQVEIEIKENKITRITLLSSSETKEYMDKVIEQINPIVLNQENYILDTIAGATYASSGYIEAIQNALNIAKIKG